MTVDLISTVIFYSFKQILASVAISCFPFRSTLYKMVFTQVLLSRKSIANDTHCVPFLLHKVLFGDLSIYDDKTDL